MSSVVQNPRLLIVDTAPAMAQVLKTYAEQNSYEPDVFSDSQEACAALTQRFVNPGASNSYDCMILGWPQGQMNIISDLLAELSSPDHSDLPVIVLSEEPDKDVQAFARRRRHTRTLLWSDYKQIEEHLQGIVINENPIDLAPDTEAVTSDTLASVNEVSPQLAAQKSPARARLFPTSILLVDNATEVSHSLKRLLETNGYTASIASTVADARIILDKRKFDLVLTEFLLPEESGIDFCKYIQTIREDRRPVCAMMTNANLDNAVQQSLAVGAIACLDKSEPIEILFDRVHTIAARLESSPVEDFKPGVAANVENNCSVNVTDGGVGDVAQNPSVPSIVLDDQQKIISANREAAIILSGGDRTLLINKNFEQTIHGAPFRLSPEEPVKALFRDLQGKMFSVTYRSWSIAGSEYGRSGDVCMLTFESEDRKIVSATDNAADEQVSVVEDSAFDSTVPTDTLHIVEATTTDVDLAAVIGVDDFVSSNDVVRQNKEAQMQAGPEQEAVTEMDAGFEQNSVTEPDVLTDSVRAKINSALNNKAQDRTSSLLMLDVKMVAAVTGDSLSLGKSELMREMLEAALLDHCDSSVSIEYDGSGKFILLYESDQPEQSRSNAESLVQQIPGLLKDLTKIELLAHASYVELLAHLKLSAGYILKHCAAACMKAEIDGLDNSVFDINASGKLNGVKPPQRESAVAQARESVQAMQREDQQMAQSA